jgi:hypothetical protein
MRSAGLRLLRRGGGSSSAAPTATSCYPAAASVVVSAFLARASSAAASAASALPSPVAPPAAAPARAPRPRRPATPTVPSPPPPPPAAAYDYQPGVLGDPSDSRLSTDLYDVGGGGGGGATSYGGGGNGGGGFAAPAAAPAAAYTSWDVYKSKAALSARVIRPRWRAVGPTASAVALDREGVFLFELAPAAPDGGSGATSSGSGSGSSSSFSSSGPAAPGTRRYDWASKLNVALSVNELGTILADPDGPHEFFHDPQKGRDGEGATRKTVRWAAAPDGRSYFFQLTVTGAAAGAGGSGSGAGGGGGGAGGGGAVRQSVSVPVSKGELYVLRRLVDFSVPYLLGFDAAFAEMVAGGGGGGEGEGGGGF